MQNILLSPDQIGQRLDHVVTAQNPHLSRAKLQRLIEDGEILVNDNRSKSSYRLRLDDEISSKTDLTGGEKRNAVPLTPDDKIVFDILTEDDDVVVVNKPSGLQVHPIDSSGSGTLANGLIARYPEMRRVGESPERPGIMHRLDRDASGLMVVARNKKAYDNLKRQFQNHEVKKEYRVLVAGEPTKNSGTITLPIGRAASGGRMAAHTDPLEGDRAAVTHYEVLERFHGAALLSVRTETGRTHQIRAHAKAIGFPVAGDVLYSGEHHPARELSPRLFLHAIKLSFTHPKTSAIVNFEAPLPEELEEVLRGLRPVEAKR